MPSYCYESLDGNVHTIVQSMFKKRPDTIWVDDVPYERNIALEHAGRKSGGGGWPMPPCIASGVGPEQAGELRDFLKKAGVPTEVAPSGDPIYRDQHHQKRALKVRGMHNRSSYD